MDDRPDLGGTLETTDTRSRSGSERRGFAVADRLAVHGSDCVCPRCAGRLLELWRRLAASLDDIDATPRARGRPREA